jgi:hypothetical protein
MTSCLALQLGIRDLTYHDWLLVFWLRVETRSQNAKKIFIGFLTQSHMSESQS